jgi:exodeoxyribonuclease VII large subunit
MYRSYASELAFEVENGMKVVVRGYVSLYEKTGQYQLYARAMEPAGKGALYVAFEKLKERLGRAGVFDPKYKKPLPAMPKTIAVVTSPTGAAVRDIVRIALRRNSSVNIAIFPTLVQGENATPDIVRAIKDVNEWGNADVIIVGRGGGSIEDLWAFNEEIVARAIFDSKIPVISAVGHETDFTIADFIADVRASTPSAAAELAVPESGSMNKRLEDITSRLITAVDKKTSQARSRYEAAAMSYILRRFPDRIGDEQVYTEELFKRMDTSVQSKLSLCGVNLSAKIEKLESISPLNILKKGYSIVYNNDTTVKCVNDVSKGDKVKIVVSDGELNAEIC